MDVYFGIKIRQCDYCLDSFMCSFMVAPYVGICEGCDLEFFLGKSLSVKVPINKEDFGIVGGFFSEMRV